MEILVSNFTGGPQQRRFKGRDYLVAPVTLIQPGVLPGSQGPLLYELPDIQESVDAWNFMPLVLNHPTDGSARTPTYLEKFGVGFVANVGAQDKLHGEVWIDIADANRIDSRIVPFIKAGKKIGVSTGLTVRVEAQNGEFNGKSYRGITRKYKPDHLAILLDQEPACSVLDGCGINNSTKETEMSKQKLVEELVLNCSCWKDEDKETLNELDEKVLNSMVEGSKAGKENADLTKRIEALESEVKNSKAILDAAKAGFQAGNHTFSVNDKGEWEKKEIKNEKEDPEPKSQSIKFEDLPLDIQEDITFARNTKQARKSELIEKLVANVADDQKEAQRTRLSNRSLQDLEGDVALLPTPEPKSEPNGQQIYLGAGGRSRIENKETVLPEALELPVWNFEPQAN